MITGYGSPITVACAVCGVTQTRNYWVTDACDQTARMSYAHAFLRTQGWVCDRRGVFCPRDVPAVMS